MAKGFTQVKGLNFHKTFAPIAKMTTVRCLLTVIIANNWELHQMDMNNVFLHSKLDEDICMCLPPGYSVPTTRSVCQLHKSLYGLRQVSHNWFAKFVTSLLAYGFHQSQVDYSLFIFHLGTNFLVVLVYIGDLIVVGNNITQYTSFKSYLDSCFKIKNLGPLKFFFLGH